MDYSSVPEECANVQAKSLFKYIYFYANSIGGDLDYVNFKETNLSANQEKRDMETLEWKAQGKKFLEVTKEVTYKLCPQDIRSFVVEYVPKMHHMFH